MSLPPLPAGYRAESLLAMRVHSASWIAQGPQGTVVLKCARTSRGRRLLIRQTKAIRASSSPHLVRHVAHDPKGAWLATAYVPGQTLSECASELTWAEREALALEIVGGLATLHEGGVVHGDLAPHNIVIDAAGHAVILDIGGMSGGTAGFAAPERSSGSPPTIHTDVYELGTTLMFLFSARPPLGEREVQLGVCPVPVSASCPEISAGVDGLLERMCCADPSVRPDMNRVRHAMVTHMGSSPAKVTFLGATEVRRSLRHQLAIARSGRPCVAVLYGPPGSGRKMLARDAAHVAKLAGFDIQSGVTAANLGHKLQRPTSGPVFAAVRYRPGQPLASVLAFLEGGTPGLIVLHAPRPIPSLTHEHVTQHSPAPLTLEIAQRWGAWAGLSHAEAHRLWSQTNGLIQSYALALATHDMDTVGTQDLPPVAAKIAEALAHHQGTQRVDVMADHLGMAPLDIIDNAQLLEAIGLLDPGGDPETLRFLPRRKRRIEWSS
ncbi:MAG: serine/threonine protein kinase [Myxococcota bacterium]